MSKANDPNIPSVTGVLLAVVCAIIISGFLIHYVHAQNKSILQITTSKKTYNVGETVVVTIKNTGKRTLEFSDSILGLTIQNTKNDQKAGLLGSQVMCELKPGESKTIHWNQKDTEGNQVQPGTYTARTSSSTGWNSNYETSITASATFTIS